MPVDEDTDGYEEEFANEEHLTATKDGKGLSHMSSIERLNVGGRNTHRPIMNSQMHHYNGGNASSMAGSALRRVAPRARSTIQGASSSHYSRPSQQGAPFQSTGPRFAISPKQCK